MKDPKEKIIVNTGVTIYGCPMWIEVPIKDKDWVVSMIKDYLRLRCFYPVEPEPWQG